MSFVVEDHHYEYLSIQHGSIAQEENLADRQKWLTAYNKSIGSLFVNIRPALPEKCANILDVGSGLGGIDVLLSRYYGGAHVDLLDSLDAPPHVFNHNIPFSKAEVALDFHKKNGSTNVECWFPAPPITTRYDLVVSFASYGFHVYPLEYTHMLSLRIKPETVIIFDVRKNRRDWLEQLVLAYGKPKVLFQAEKFVRCAFRGK